MPRDNFPSTRNSRGNIRRAFALDIGCHRMSESGIVMVRDLAIARSRRVAVKFRDRENGGLSETVVETAITPGFNIYGTVSRLYDVAANRADN